jgi:hypothetical protein
LICCVEIFNIQKMYFRFHLFSLCFQCYWKFVLMVFCNEGNNIITRITKKKCKFSFSKIRVPFHWNLCLFCCAFWMWLFFSNHNQWFIMSSKQHFQLLLWFWYFCWHIKTRVFSVFIPSMFSRCYNG